MNLNLGAPSRCSTVLTIKLPEHAYLKGINSRITDIIGKTSGVDSCTVNLAMKGVSRGHRPLIKQEVNIPDHL